VDIYQNELIKDPQCDCLIWSIYGRYAIVSISFKLEREQTKAVSVIKVWDSITGHITQDLAKENNLELSTASFVLACHPKYEEILMTGSEGGQLILWNL